MRYSVIAAIAVISTLVLSGCSGNKELINQKDMQITRLEVRVDSLRGEVDSVREAGRTRNETLEEQLNEKEKELEICLDEKDDLVRVRISGDIRFESGSSRLTESSRKVLDAAWEKLQGYSGKPILIEGHTDNVPIAESYRHIFPSNWELSTARAAAALHYFVDKHGADPRRLTVLGRGKYQPAADNGTPEGRSRNRRVEIKVQGDK